MGGNSLVPNFCFKIGLPLLLSEEYIGFSFLLKRNIRYENAKFKESISKPIWAIE